MIPCTHDNGCPNQHYTKVISKEYNNDTCSFIDLTCHPLVCYDIDNDTQCHSKLRTLREVSTIILFQEISCMVYTVV